MTKLDASRARDEFSETLSRVAYGKERVVLRRRGRDLAAMVPIEDLEALQKLDDESDVREAKKVLRDLKRKGEKPIPFAEVKKKLGL